MKLKRFIISAAFAISAFLLPFNVQAAQKNNIVLKPNTTYTKYDITGDGKADKIRINFKSESYLNIYVNGRQRFNTNAKELFLANANLYTLKGNKNFLKLKCQHIANDHISYDKILSYKSGKLVSVTDLMSHRKGATNYRHNSFTHKIGDNYIQIRVQSMPSDIGSIQYIVTYKLSGDNLKLSSSTYPVTSRGYHNPVASNFNFWSTAKKINLLDTPGGNIIHTVDKYAICTIKKVRYYQSNAYIYITDDDESISGWIKCHNKYTGNYFLESYFI